MILTISWLTFLQTGVSSEPWFLGRLCDSCHQRNHCLRKNQGRRRLLRHGILGSEICRLTIFLCFQSGRHRSACQSRTVSTTENSSRSHSGLPRSLGALRTSQFKTCLKHRGRDRIKTCRKRRQLARLAFKMAIGHGLPVCY